MAMTRAAQGSSTCSVMKFCAPVMFTGASATASTAAAAPAAPAMRRSPANSTAAVSTKQTVAESRSAVSAEPQNSRAIGMPSSRSPGGSQRFNRKNSSRNAPQSCARISAASAIAALAWPR